MLELTAPDHSRTLIEATKIRRIRGAIGVETDDGCRTLINWIQDALVLEPPADVVAKAKAELTTLIQLTQLNNTPVWLNSIVIEGPVRITRWEKQDGARSAILLNGKKLYLLDSGQQVHDAINAGGGKASPVPDEANSLVSDAISAARNWMISEKAWDK